jgi:hypothetical protein
MIDRFEIFSLENTNFVHACIVNICKVKMELIYYLLNTAIAFV